jgi:hypothetical protein
MDSTYNRQNDVFLFGLSMKYARIKPEWRDKGEGNALYLVSDNDGVRCDMQPVECDMFIVPTQRANCDMLDFVTPPE